MTEAFVRVSSKGQVVLPSDTRKELHISKGTKLRVITEHGAIIMLPLKKLSKLRGILTTDKIARDILRELRNEWDLELR